MSADDMFYRIQREGETEFLAQELRRLRMGPPDGPIVYMLRDKPVVRLAREDAERMVLAEYAEGLRHKLRTKDEILAFLYRNQIPFTLLEGA